MTKLDLTYCGYQVLEFTDADYHEFEYGAFDGDDLCVVRAFMDNHGKLWFVATDIWDVCHYEYTNCCATKYTRDFVSHNEVAYTYWMDERLFLVSSMGLVDLYYNKPGNKSVQLKALHTLNEYIADVVYPNIKTQVNKHLVHRLPKEAEGEAEGEVIDITPSCAEDKADKVFEDICSMVRMVEQMPKLIKKAISKIMNENATLKQRVAELEAQLDAVRNALN